MVHFPVSNTSLPAETLPWKMQPPFFSSSAALMLKRKADEHVERFENSYNKFSEWNIGQISMYCEIFTQGTQEYGDVLYAALNSLSFMLA